MRASKLLGLGVIALIAAQGSPARGQTFVDWTTIDPAQGTATGTLAGSIVSLASVCGLAGAFPCGLYDGAGVNGGFTGFSSSALFATPAASSDYVGILGGPANGTAYGYAVAFTVPVIDPVILIENLASTMVFTIPPGSTLTRLSGDPTIDARSFTVTGTTVVGSLLNCSQPCRVDAAGEIQISGAVSAFAFTAIYDTPGNPGNIPDGINIQIAGTVAPPDAGVTLDASAEDASGEDATAAPDTGVATDAGTPADAGQLADAGAADTGTRIDAGTARDAGPSDSGSASSSDASLTPGDEDSGCGCSASPAHARAWPALALPLLLALTRRRRR